MSLFAEYRAGSDISIAVRYLCGVFLQQLYINLVVIERNVGRRLVVNGGDELAAAHTREYSLKLVSHRFLAELHAHLVKVTEERHVRLFVKVEQTGTFVDAKVTYSIADGWTKGNGAIPEGVYYREVKGVTADSVFPVLKDDKITVSSELTKEEIQNITDPTLTFTAYAVQKEGINTAAEAWARIDTTAAP